MKLQHSALSDIGKSRSVNQDSLGVTPPLPDGSQLFIVCDGMGGHMAGEVASQTAVETMLKTFPADAASDFPQALTQTLLRANNAVFERGRGNMGTTAVALLLYKNVAFLANVGDSRAYLLRGDQFRQVTVDHSFVEEQVRAGLMTREQAYHSSVKNIITRAIGHQKEIDVDIFREQVQAGDIFLLSSDGLHGYVEESVIAETIRSTPFEQITPRLIELANNAGGLDNITAIVVRVESLDDVAADDPLLVNLLAQTPPQNSQTTLELSPEEIERSATGTARLPVMRDDPAGATSAQTRANAAAIPPPLTPKAQTQRGLSLWGILGALVVLLALAGILYAFDLPPMSLLKNSATATVTQPTTTRATTIPTVTAMPIGSPTVATGVLTPTGTLTGTRTLTPLLPTITTTP